MHPRDKRTSVGRTADPLPFRRGKERGRAHSEAVSSSLVHAFPPVKTLQKDSGVWITRPQHASSLGSAHLHFLFIIPHPVCAVFAPPPPPPISLFSLCHSPIVELISPPSVRPLLAVFSFFFCASFFFLPQMNSRARSPPATVDLGLRDTAVVYIYFFSIVVVIIIINIIATGQFPQMGSGRRLQRRTRSST